MINSEGKGTVKKFRPYRFRMAVFLIELCTFFGVFALVKQLPRCTKAIGFLAFCGKLSANIFHFSHSVQSNHSNIIHFVNNSFLIAKYNVHILHSVQFSALSVQT